MIKQDLFEIVNSRQDTLCEVATQLWDEPELGLREERAAETIRSLFEAEGFDVERAIGGMPTAFTARYGKGEPRIGVLGEYDALPGMSQRISAAREPVTAGAPGHGCGHNLLGVGSLGGVLALKQAIDTGAVDGTVVYYGCPAEELLVGKVYMARAGVFDGLDAALTWHPGDITRPERTKFLAMDSVQYSFTGQSAHAAAAPEAGRSALDAVQLMNTGVEYVREHVDSDVRIHYSIVDSGDIPNVVPASATVWYNVRAPDRDTVDHIARWLDDIAAGAALMTRTEQEKRPISKCHDFVPNDVVTDTIWGNLQEVGRIEYDDADRSFAAELQESLDEATLTGRFDGLPESLQREVRDEALYTDPSPDHNEGPHSASTDVGDVSRITPTGQFRVATWPVGTPFHSWQAVAANGDFAMKGMLYAAKVIAATTYDLLSDGEILAAARTEFERTVGASSYDCALPPNVEPPFDVSRG